MGQNYYGVLIGRDGPAVYSDWNQCEEATADFPGSFCATFATEEEAKSWVERWAPAGTIRMHELLGLDGFKVAQVDAESESSTSTTDRSGSFQRSPDRPRRPSLSAYKQALQHHKDDDRNIDTAFQCETVATTSQEVILSREQTRVLERVMRGESVFFTGSAGTGKSALLRKIIQSLGGPSAEIAVTASTGIAAVNIGGTTLHSFAGVGLGKGDPEQLVERVKISKFASERWCRTRTLIIDEISMIDGRFFDALELIARAVRKNSAPFGGIQLVLSGDFCQLPPVPDQLGGVMLPIKFAFEATSWAGCVGPPVVLQRVFRQEDKEFVSMLNRMRYGKLKKADEECFLALSRPLKYDDGIEPTELYPLRNEVEHANAVRLGNLPGPSHTYLAFDVPGTDHRGMQVTAQHAQKLLERLVAVKSIMLKVGAQVMLIKNLTPGFVNGLLGKVTAFKTVEKALRDSNELSVAGSSQTSTFSSVSTVSSSMLTDEALRERVWPLVRFTNGHDVLCFPTTFDVVNARGDVEAHREQVPLILAWAMSVHKSQGQTLDRVKINLARTFEKGQAYVALSRATRMETLQVLHFNKNKVMAHPRVLAWNDRITKEMQEEEEAAILQEMDSEEAIRAFFENNDMI